MSDSDQINPSADETLPPRAASEGVGDSSIADQPTFVGSVAPTPAANRTGDTHPQFEGYEILDELGRGGMGVVYKARDLNLDRTVALKMIIGGKFASDDDIQRFKLEAESAARLDHPGIVPIFDIGEAGGNHFFSMKMIDGGSLSNEGEQYKDDARKSAELMIKVARAVQHAHERGVLHRDLKPANILIDENGDPLITDLGLAKRMDGDSGLTQTGMAMGTPGFMAPEQAQGRKDITTSADIFSLGAILYWLQTGTAPFKGNTAIETLVATLEDEIPSLRSTLPKADGDLDLICQKAMHRDPTKRYNSAAALASDLQAWLNGDLLSVRAPTAVSMASVWIRKNLRTVLGASLAGSLAGLVVGVIMLIGALKNAAEQEFRIQQLGGSSETWVTHFLSFRNLPAWWEAIQMLIIPSIAVAAFFCVLIVRPQTREANIVSAVTAGLAAGVVAFLAGIGWQPVNEASIDTAAHDIELLANAVWFESDVERELAKEVLIQRYPGLQDMEIAGRQKRIREKIKHDQKTGVLPGIWMGIGLSVLFTGLPMMFSCFLSGVLWQEGARGWQWFGGTWERCAYCLLIFLVLSFWLRDVKPSFLLMIFTLVGLAVPLYLAVTQGRWYWRVLLIPLPFVLMGILNWDVANMRYAVYLASHSTDEGELRELMQSSDRRLSQVKDAYARYRTAIGWLSLGEEEKYQHHCRKLLNNFENAYRPEIASRLAKVSLLRPDLQDEKNLQTFYKLAELACGFESSKLHDWFRLTRAISEVRQGHADEALTWNNKSRDLPHGNGYMISAVHAVDALAWLQKNDVEKAKASLKQGQTLCGKTRKVSFEDGDDDGWVDYRVFLIFEKEVQAEIERLSN